jgi:hypothetical protein
MSKGSYEPPEFAWPCIPRDRTGPMDWSTSVGIAATIVLGFLTLTYFGGLVITLAAIGVAALAVVLRYWRLPLQLLRTAYSRITEYPHLRANLLASKRETHQMDERLLLSQQLLFGCYLELTERARSDDERARIALFLLPAIEAKGRPLFPLLWVRTVTRHDGKAALVLTPTEAIEHNIGDEVLVCDRYNGDVLGRFVLARHVRTSISDSNEYVARPHQIGNHEWWRKYESHVLNRTSPSEFTEIAVAPGSTSKEGSQ